MQKRWWAGSLYAVAFSITAGWFFWRAFAVLWAYYQMGLDREMSTGEAPSVMRLLIPCVIMLGVYLANVVDAVFAQPPASPMPPVLSPPR